MTVFYLGKARQVYLAHFIHNGKSKCFTYSKYYFDNMYLNQFENLIYACDVLLQYSTFFRNHSNKLICCPKNISNYYPCWKVWSLL